MSHAGEAAPGTTLALRVGTSTCGGLDDEDVFGEIGWVATRPESQTFETEFSVVTLAAAGS